MIRTHAPPENGEPRDTRPRLRGDRRGGLLAPGGSSTTCAARRAAARSRRRSSTRASRARSASRDARRAVPPPARRPRRRRRRRGGEVDPLAVLERVCAIPFASEAAAQGRDHRPAERPGLDELGSRPAARSSSSSRPRATSSPRSGASRVLRGAERRLDDAGEEAVDAEEDDLEADDGISDAPLVRLVNSIIFQAAEEGASDIHVEPRGGRADRPLPDRRRPPRRSADPEAAHPGRDDPPEGAREARHRRAAQAAGRPHLAARGRRRPPARHPRRDAADGREARR